MKKATIRTYVSNRFVDFIEKGSVAASYVQQGNFGRTHFVSPSINRRLVDRAKIGQSERSVKTNPGGTGYLGKPRMEGELAEAQQIRGKTMQRDIVLPVSFQLISRRCKSAQRCHEAVSSAQQQGDWK